MDTEAMKKAEEIENALAEGRIDRVAYYSQLADLDAFEEEPEEEEVFETYDEEAADQEEELESTPPLEKKSVKDETGENEKQTSAREELQKRYPGSPELW